jgi:hypothetical protein
MGGYWEIDGQINMCFRVVGNSFGARQDGA